MTDEELNVYFDGLLEAGLVPVVIMPEDDELPRTIMLAAVGAPPDAEPLARATIPASELVEAPQERLWHAFQELELTV